MYAERQSRSRSSSTSSQRERQQTGKKEAEKVPQLKRRPSTGGDEITMLPSTQEAEAKKTTDTPSAQVHQSATDDHTYTLPTKAEAINEGGKPAYQFKKIRETNYGKLLDTIDKYHALNESDRDARTRKLLEMQSLIVRWLENPDRQNNNEGDRAKASFLGRIRPIIKVLYYKTKTNREVFDPINSDAATNAELNKQLIQAELENKHLISDHEFINSLLNKVKQAPLTTNFRAETLNSFLKGGTDWQNAFQTMYKDQSPGGDLGTEELGGAKQREDAERYLGYSPFTEEQRENRPAYTAVNVLNNPKGASSGYGKCYFVWKEHVKKRATYTAFDSLEMRSNQKNKGVKREESIGTHEHIGATLAQNKDVLLALTKMVQGQELSSKELNSRYIEAAIHGGLSLDDVAELVVAFPKNESPEIWGQEYVDKFNQKYPNIKITYKPT